jgi:hypothetical protein
MEAEQMGDWTHKNLRDVEDKAPGCGIGEVLKDEDFWSSN